jgi:hypothetical protein
MTLADRQLGFSGEDDLRADRRFKIELLVLVNTVMSDQKGWVVDVSRCGLKVRGIHAPPRSRVFVHYNGQFAEGTVRWAKAGPLIGIVLDTPLRTGPLAEIWRRFHDNVEAFGKNTRTRRPTFGRKRL